MLLLKRGFGSVLTGKAISYVGVGTTIVFTVVGQLLLKHRLGTFGRLPDSNADRIAFVGRVAVDPIVMLGLGFAGFAFLSWIVALANLELSRAYPFTALSYILIIVFSGLFLNEPVTLAKVLGVGLVILGITIASQGE
jgi:multidrug transporter EmrE-like cation transporter